MDCPRNRLIIRNRKNFLLLFVVVVVAMKAALRCFSRRRRRRQWDDDDADIEFVFGESFPPRFLFLPLKMMRGGRTV